MWIFSGEITIFCGWAQLPAMRPAFCGSDPALRRYNNLDTLEDGYGISLRPLAMFAQEMYGGDPCTGVYAGGIRRNGYG